MIPSRYRPRWEDLLARTGRILTQKTKDKNIIYAVHEPELECFGKGNAGKPHESASKVSFAIAHKHGASNHPESSLTHHLLATSTLTTIVSAQMEPSAILLEDIGVKPRRRLWIWGSGARTLILTIRGWRLSIGAGSRCPPKCSAVGSSADRP